MDNLKNSCFLAIVNALADSKNTYRSKTVIEKNDLVETLAIEISSVSNTHISKFVLTFPLVLEDDEDDDLLNLDHFFNDVFYGDCLVSSEGLLDDVGLFIEYFFDEHDDNLGILSNLDDRQ